MLFCSECYGIHGILQVESKYVDAAGKDAYSPNVLKNCFDGSILLNNHRKGVKVSVATDWFICILPDGQT